jgi:diguanylate cyclase (GGDEF)-like protein
MWKTLLSTGEWRGEFHNRKKDGSLYWSRTSISGVKDGSGDITHFVGIQDDVTHEYELTERLSYQASHDMLTGLINRLEFERRAERLLATIEHDQGEHALCYMDLDQFKVVNDTCGHAAGDELLRQLSIVLQAAVRHRDTLARLGGDEFGVLMEHCQLDDARRVTSTLQKAVRDFQFSWEEHSFKVGVSIGLVAVNTATPSLTELLKAADAACYRAKELGRDRIHIYRPEDPELAERHGEMQWVSRIHRALEEDRFCLYAQVIAPLDGDSKETRYELTLRMIDAQGALSVPCSFLPAAERYNVMMPLDRWVIEKTFSLLAAHPAFLEQVEFISINLSGHSLADDKFHAFVIDQLNAKSIPSEKICFEITETAAITNLGTANAFITKMKTLGNF